MAGQDYAQLKKLAEEILAESDVTATESELSNGILALLSELEQAEQERDEASAETAACLQFLGNTLQWEGFRLEMLTEKDDVKKSNSHQENIRLLSNYLAEKGHGIKFLAALRTLREASRAVVDGYTPMVCCDWCSAKFVADNYGIPRGTHEPDCEFLALAAALAVEGGK